MSRPLTNIQTIRGARREAGTLPRSPRIKWRAGTPDAPLQVPYGTESMLMNAALARVHASSSRRMKRSGDELPPCTWSGCGGRLNGVAVVRKLASAVAVATLPTVLCQDVPGSTARRVACSNAVASIGRQSTGCCMWRQSVGCWMWCACHLAVWCSEMRVEGRRRRRRPWKPNANQ